MKLNNPKAVITKIKSFPLRNELEVHEEIEKLAELNNRSVNGQIVLPTRGRAEKGHIAGDRRHDEATNGQFDASGHGKVIGLKSGYRCRSGQLAPHRPVNMQSHARS